MYNNFLEQTILTGYIDEIYLQNFPNSLLIQNGKEYKLSVENECFICKIQVLLNGGDNITRNVKLPINNTSKNYIVYWGDNTTSQLIELDCKDKDIYKDKDIKDLVIGASYIDYQQKYIYIFNGIEFIRIKNTTNISCNDITKYALKIDKSKTKVDKYSLYNYSSSIMQHKYPDVQASYYIKIKGGFTGFNSKNNNCFYLVERSTLPNYNFINIPSSTAEYLNISGMYIKTNTNNNIQTYLHESNLSNLSGKRIELDTSAESGVLYWLSQESTQISGELSGNFKKFNNSKIDLLYENGLSTISWKNIFIYNDVEKIKLTDILSWGTNTNWQDMNYAFYNAKYLKSIPKISLPNVNDFISCFENCSLLKIDNPESIMPIATIDTTRMFYNSGVSGNLSTFIMAPHNSIITNMFNAVQKKEYLPKNYKNFQYISGEISYLNIS